ncbi:hypothetical protein AGR1B_Cc110118 [Agrobacterium fabacearum S56]|nr:hypothetical protein AGR1B_Cc110118 [Agrobacterium fabacearum S56]
MAAYLQAYDRSASLPAGKVLEKSQKYESVAGCVKNCFTPPQSRATTARTPPSNRRNR